MTAAGFFEAANNSPTIIMVIKIIRIAAIIISINIIITTIKDSSQT